MSELVLDPGDYELVLLDNETEIIIATYFLQTGFPSGYTADFTTNAGFITFFYNGTPTKKIRLLDL